MTSTATGSFATEMVSIDALRPDPANPRSISPAGLDSLERSIRSFGFVQPVIARRADGTVIGGHQRLLAGRRLGLASVPVVWLDLEPEKARLLGLALNRISGTWDQQLLARLLAELNTSPDVDVTLSGFRADEIGDLLRSLEAREKRDRPESFDLDTALEEARRSGRAEPGSLWALGRARHRPSRAACLPRTARTPQKTRSSWGPAPHGRPSARTAAHVRRGLTIDADRRAAAEAFPTRHGHIDIERIHLESRTPTSRAFRGYQGEHRLLCGDGTKPADVERLLGGGRADMAFCDGPYKVEPDPAKMSRS